MTADEIVKNENRMDGTAAWHEAGYIGIGAVCLHMESEDSSHGRACRERILQAAPGADVILHTHTCLYDKKKVYEDHMKGTDIPFADFVDAHNVDTVSRSVGGGASRGNALSRLYNGVKANRKISFFASAGNDGTDGEAEAGSSIPEDVAIYVGACYRVPPDYKELAMTNYSSLGENGVVDFSDFTGSAEGTSFAAPYLAGKAALLIGRYGKMSQDELFEYFRMNAVDIPTKYDDGTQYDRWSGWGQVVLPDPKLDYIQIPIKEYECHINGKPLLTDTPAIIKNNRTFVPIRFLAEAMGASVKWDDKERSFTINRRGQYTKAVIGSRTMYRNGEPVEMDVAPFIMNNRSMLPLRFIAEALNCKVGWVESERKVIIIG